MCLSGYDNFRENFLHARSDLMDSVPIKKDGKMVWIDVGGGTARNLEFLPVRTHTAANTSIWREAEPASC